MADPKKLKVDWDKIDQLEHRSFPTDESYEVTIRREAIPLIFVPGIMGSRLYHGADPVWDPNDSAGLAKMYALSSPQNRKKKIIGPGAFDPAYLGVVGNRLDTPHTPMTDSFRKQFMDQNDVNWSWNNDDRNVTEQAGFDAPQFSASGKTSYKMDDHILQFTSPDNVQEAPPPRMGGVYEQMLRARERAVFNGWAGVAWPFYGEIIMKLATNSWRNAGLRKFFYFPVYAFGYNWTKSNVDSGKELAELIPRIKAKEQEGGRLCEKVILVTHSMGGLVARACSKHLGGAGILGIVHGAQPAVGTPAAYHQLRAGEDFVPFQLFKQVSGLYNSGMQSEALAEYVSPKVIGATNKDTDPVFGNAPGPCELLPFDKYKTNISNHVHSDSARWLFEIGPSGGPPLPSAKGPYDSIYEGDTDFRSVQRDAPNVVTDVLDKPDDRKRSAAGAGTSGKQALNATLEKAKVFQDTVSNSCHPVTYYSYAHSHPQKTYDEIVYKFKRKKNDDYTVYSEFGGPQTIRDNQKVGQGTDYDPATHSFYEIQPKSGSGDGTVATSSATSLGAPGGLRTPAKDEVNPPDVSYPANPHIIRARALDCSKISKLDHTSFYNHAESQEFTLKAITEIAQNYCLVRRGLKGKQAQLPIL